MWTYNKQLQYPVKIKNPNPALAKIIITQIGGPDGELGASLRYLNQFYLYGYRFPYLCLHYARRSPLKLLYSYIYLH